MYTMKKEFLEKLYINPRVKPRKLIQEAIKKAEEASKKTVDNKEGMAHAQDEDLLLGAN